MYIFELGRKARLVQQRGGGGRGGGGGGGRGAGFRP